MPGEGDIDTQHNKGQVRGKKIRSLGVRHDTIREKMKNKFDFSNYICYHIIGKLYKVFTSNEKHKNTAPCKRKNVTLFAKLFFLNRN